jgi:carbon storage regulator
MLVLSRKTEERIVIADSIVLTVLDVKSGRVRLGIEAPPTVRILRQELAPIVTRATHGPTAKSASR